jgi:hypothetical protein
MLDAHVHCAECGEAIPTQVKLAGGKTKDRTDIHAGIQYRPVPSPQGINLVPVQVPLCATCGERIAAAAERAKTASKLVVPGLSAVPNNGRPT